ncbi:MAG: GntP family permease [Treponema sp.]|jgi:GntP family gluconate:H+ symporter|nr:GntP family permease [Treponema sp.]
MKFLILYIIAITGIILAISKGRLHPFLAIMGISGLLGLVLGIPPVEVIDEDGAVTQGIADVISTGFSGTFTSIGVIIILGSLIGAILETTGGAFKLGDMIIKRVGPNHPVLAMLLLGWAVAIPVGCESGFIMIDPLRKALVRRIKASGAAMTVALSSGLYASHVFIPPTPGPIAAAHILGAGNNMLLIMALGIIVSIPALIGSFLYACFAGDKIQSAEDLKMDETPRSYQQILGGYGTLPEGFTAAAPILLPILCMSLGSFAVILGWTGPTLRICTFLGTPIVAFSIGFISAVSQLGSTGKLNALYGITHETLKIIGPMVCVTGAGGALGQVITAAGIVDFITENSGFLGSAGILFPFLVSGILKSLQGSSMAAQTAAAGITAPLLEVLGLDSPSRTALTVIALGAGAMTVSHGNDSYFWVVTNFGNMTPPQGYKTHTIATLIEGISALIGILLLSLVLP